MTTCRTRRHGGLLLAATLCVGLLAALPAVGRASTGWTQGPAMPQGRGIFGYAVLHDGRVLVAGGQIDRIPGLTQVSTATAVIYDPVARRWGMTGSLLQDRKKDKAITLRDGRVLVVGGWSKQDVDGYGRPLNRRLAERYDPSTGRFSPAGTMLADQRLWPSLAELPDGRVLVVGGGQSSAETWNPNTQTFSPAGDTGVPRLKDATVALADGRVLVAGGFDSATNQPTARSEVFDWRTDTWTRVADLPVACFGATANRLADGRVLVAGGILTSDGHATATAELFDPATGTWTSVAPMRQARGDQTAVVLGDGSVLVVAGVATTGTGMTANLQYLTSTERFDPTTMTWSSSGSLATPRDVPAVVDLAGDVVAFGGFSGPEYPLPSSVPGAVHATDAVEIANLG